MTTVNDRIAQRRVIALGVIALRMMGALCISSCTLTAWLPLSLGVSNE